MTHPPLSYRDYRRYLQSRAWRARRRHFIALAGGCCSECGGSLGLQVHHVTYERLGRERFEDVEVMCSRCHGRITQAPRRHEALNRAWLLAVGAEDARALPGRVPGSARGRSPQD